MKRIVAIFYMTITIFQLTAQTDSIVKWTEDNDVFEDIESIVEEKLEQLGDDIDYSDEVEELMQYKNKKIGVNSMTAEAALKILHLTDYQYYQLLLYVEQYGPIVSVAELYAIEGFTPNDIQRIVPWIEINSIVKRKPFSRFFQNSRNELLLRYGQIMERQKGYEKGTEKNYLGSPQKLAFRYSFETNDLFSFGIAGEKDAGEEFFRGTQKQGFDFYSFHIELKNINILRKLVIGDYKMNFGQGLIIGSSLMGSKGGGAGNCRKFTTGTRAVTALNESDIFRGISVEIGNAKINGTLFYSHRFYDGKISQNDEEDSFFDGSLSTNGYHRTENEMIKKNVLRNRSYGFHFQINRRIFRIGLQGIRTEFEKPLSISDVLYQKYRFSGRSSCNLSIDYQLILKKYVLFGEFASDDKLHLAVLQGLLMELDPRIKCSMLFRFYSKQFIALSGSGFAESAFHQGEMGLYFASDIILSTKTTMSLGTDFYQLNWLQYNVDAPQFGCDFNAKWSFTLSRYSQLIFRYDYHPKFKNDKTKFVNEIQQQNRHRVKLSVNSTLLSWMNVKTEADLLINKDHFNKQTRLGILLFQDFGMSFDKIGLDLKLRIAYFDTDSYDERLYAYENDVLYCFSSNAHFGTGIRGFLLFKYGWKWFSISLRIARTYYIDRLIIGSGLEQINSPHKTELKAQLVLKL
ncbi:MAG: hypothetical protein MJZ76_02505 [Bacteroidales bacterium]|nr:hypothetical protein [Bacteroidales bacterium]